MIINHHKSCPLHPSKSKLESLQLDVLYHYVSGNQLKEIHNSKNDVTAQTQIVSSNSFLPFTNQAVSVRHIKEIFLKSECIAMLKKIVPFCQIYEPLIEQTESSNIAWEPVRDDTYTGPYGGPKCGPLNKIVDAGCKNKSIVTIFLFIL